jgi:DNA-binding NarL/FixJ family response regulator
MSIRIILFDDNSKRREGLELLISSIKDIECAGSFNDCRDVIENVKRTSPDVILMDIDMPFVNGIEGVRLIRENQITAKILMQTVFEDDEKVFDAICAGADGYILKQATPGKLIDAIREVTLGGAPMTPVIARKVLDFFSKTHTQKSKEDFKLTKREQEILQFLVKGFSYKMIADECHISYPTVNSHITSIYRKLQVQSVAGAVSKALREGLI